MTVYIACFGNLNSERPDEKVPYVATCSRHPGYKLAGNLDFTNAIPDCEPFNSYMAALGHAITWPIHQLDDLQRQVQSWQDSLSSVMDHNKDVYDKVVEIFNLTGLVRDDWNNYHEGLMLESIKTWVERLKASEAEKSQTMAIMLSDLRFIARLLDIDSDKISEWALSPEEPAQLISGIEWAVKNLVNNKMVRIRVWPETYGIVILEKPAWITVQMVNAEEKPLCSNCGVNAADYPESPLCLSCKDALDTAMEDVQEQEGQETDAENNDPSWHQP